MLVIREADVHEEQRHLLTEAHRCPQYGNSCSESGLPCPAPFPERLFSPLARTLACQSLISSLELSAVLRHPVSETPRAPHTGC